MRSLWTEVADQVIVSPSPQPPSSGRWLPLLRRALLCFVVLVMSIMWLQTPNVHRRYSAVELPAFGVQVLVTFGVTRTTGKPVFKFAITPLHASRAEWDQATEVSGWIRCYSYDIQRTETGIRIILFSLRGEIETQRDPRLTIEWAPDVEGR